MVEEIVRMDGISKSIDGYYYLNNAWVNLRKNETVGILGMNSAGKTLLMQILMGISEMNSGIIYIDDKPVDGMNPARSRKAGISYLQGKSSLMEEFSVLDNMCLMPRKENVFFNKQTEEMRSNDILRKYGCESLLFKSIKGMSRFEKLIIEILREICRESRILILDGILEQITSEQIDDLRILLEKLNSDGVSLFVLDYQSASLIDLCSRIFVLRRGVTAAVFNRADFDEDTLNSVMVGTDLASKVYIPHNCDMNSTLFELSNVSSGEHLKQISLSVHEGEVVGICTLQELQKEFLLKLLIGDAKIGEGSAFFDGHEYHAKDYLRLTRNGVQFITRKENYFPDLSLYDNVLLSANKYNLSKVGFIRRGYSKFMFNYVYCKYLQHTNAKFSKKMLVRNPDKLTSALIGVARYSASNRKSMIVCVDVTSNMDIVTSQTLLRHIAEITDTGSSVLCISSDIYELLSICNRIYLMSPDSRLLEISNCASSKREILNTYKVFCTHGA